MMLTICATLIRNSRENLFLPLYFKLVPSAPLRRWVAVTATMSLPDFPMCPLPSHEELIESKFKRENELKLRKFPFPK